SSALLAGRPRANRNVLSNNVWRDRFTPINSDRSTRLTRATGDRRSADTCQTKASAVSTSGARKGGGEIRSSAAAIRSSGSIVIYGPQDRQVLHRPAAPLRANDRHA